MHSHPHYHMYMIVQIEDEYELAVEDGDGYLDLGPMIHCDITMFCNSIISNLHD